MLRWVFFCRNMFLFYFKHYQSKFYRHNLHKGYLVKLNSWCFYFIASFMLQYKISFIRLDCIQFQWTSQMVNMITFLLISSYVSDYKNRNMSMSIYHAFKVELSLLEAIICSICLVMIVLYIWKLIMRNRVLFGSKIDW